MPDPTHWPEWWQWQLEFTDHLYDRMAQRGFTETDLRTMLADASGYVPGQRPGRWRIQSQWSGRRWEVVVEPDVADEMLVVVMAYEVS